MGGYPIVSSQSPGVSTILIPITPPAEPQVALLIAPTVALSLSTTADSSATLPASAIYLNYAFQNLAGNTTVGSSEASITPATADAYSVSFAVTLEAGSTGILVGYGTASGGEAQYASVSAAATVSFIGTNTAGVTATVSGSTLTVTITAPPSDTAIAMPTANTALSSPVSTIAPPAAPTLAQAADSTGLAATTYYLKISNGATNAVGAYAWTPTSAEASIAIATAGNNITFSSTLPTGATAILIGMGTASDGESEFAYVNSAAAVTYIGTNYEGIAATVSGSTLSVTITQPPQDTSHPMPMTYLAAATTYTYAETALSAFDNAETTVSSAVSQTTDSAYPVVLNLQTSAGAGSLNVYKNGNFLATSPNLQYIDNGDVATTSAVPPSVNETAYLTAPVVEATGIGPTTAGRYVGQTDGAPTSGAFLIGDFADDPTNATVWICTASGSPGTWAKATPASATTSAAGVVEVEQTTSTTPVVGTVVASTTPTGEVEITGTTAQTVLSYTPSRQGNFILAVYFRVVTAATTVQIEATYDDGSGAQTLTLLSSTSEAVGSYAPLLAVMNATTGAPIAIQVTAGTANQVYVSASILGV